ncbi:unnamed protein product [Tilletia controversa]|uniref:PWWP domain-containing protein n=2 Tax=Tilletia TaxID=13289 RepID=A0A177U178_9BASI|nr:hypothetical protein CF328_g7878 [Tilletia controversa]KAE8185234.1 hypothetical protein CF335_g7781 [Tilletia laevis]KAE8243468.1 hypothetical protein A4X03_0g7757 [Tilletia caries]KAE8194555.1 hypothetical protein CF336_g3486 [Tilletia laevis]CAD6890200.1 unnamed protein product [Tilletia caries]
MAPGSKKAKDTTHKDDYKNYEVVLAKMKGYPLWPAWVTEGPRVPHKVAKAKPRVGKYVLCGFFGEVSYSWLPPRDVKPLTKPMIDEFLASDGSKKDKTLLLAYEQARNPEAHIQAQETAAHKHNNFNEEEEEGQDELAEEDEDEGEADASAGSKRKRNKEKSKVKAPVVKKQKKEKDPAAAAPVKPVSSKKKPRQSEAMTEAGDDGDNDEQGTPETKLVKGWRHQLQRAFLGKSPPKESDMPSMAEIFKQVEAHQMSEDAYKQTKIGKVMKKITQMKDEFPRESEFKFKERAEELCKKWKNLGASTSGEGAGAESPAQDTETKPASAAAKANGDGEAAAAAGAGAASVGGAEQDKPAPVPAEVAAAAAPAAAPATAA